MKYVNGVAVLPEELIDEIRKYAQGVYIYIPKSSEKRDKWGKNTNHPREMELRNLHIYDKYLVGINCNELANCYHLSLKSIRRIVLQQKKGMEPVKVMMKEILKEWNMKKEPVQIYHSAWRIENDFVLKEYSDKNALLRNIQIHKILRKMGIPVAEIISLTNGSEYYENDDKMYLLTTKLKGKNILAIEKMNASWFFDFGKIIANLHLAFKECEKTMSYWSNSLLEEMQGWVSKNLEEYQPEFLPKKEQNEAICQLSNVYKELPKQLIHRDVHLGNFLFDDIEFSGYIDFDLTQSNIRIFDICYFLLGLRLKEDNHWIAQNHWFEMVNQVIEGYHSMTNLTEVERRSIPCVMKNIELLFVAYFLGIGDEKLAKDSAELFLFVVENEEKILEASMYFLDKTT